MPSTPAGGDAEEMTTTEVHDVSPRQLAWLETELARWEGSGLLAPDQTTAIRAGYRASDRFSLARLGLMLGGAFVGIGLLWLVAANLDQLPPLGRFVAVTALWIAVAVAAEALATRPTHDSPSHGSGSPVVGALRGVTALLFGAVVMQAAQSLQVPAWEPRLVGIWALGALLHAYAVRGVAPLVVGAATSLVWLVWQTVEQAESGLAVVLVLASAAVLATALAVLHETQRWPSFARCWRVVGALLALGTLFGAAVPEVGIDDFAAGPMVVALPILAVLLGVGATVLARGRRDLEALAVLAAGVLAVLLVLWETSSDVAAVGVAEWLHTIVAVVAFVLVAGWLAVVGIRRDSTGLTWVAIGSLVVFTTFQAFGVFAAIVDGAWLFLVLGLVFAGTGYVADRGRRQLAAALGDADAAGGAGDSDTDAATDEEA